MQKDLLKITLVSVVLSCMISYFSIFFANVRFDIAEITSIFNIIMCVMLYQSLTNIFKKKNIRNSITSIILSIDGILFFEFLGMFISGNKSLLCIIVCNITILIFFICFIIRE